MSTGDFPDEDVRTVAATETSFRIIETLERLEGAGVTEVATDLSLTKSTVYKHLTTLRKLGYVVKDDTTYRLAISFLGLGVSARSRLQLLDAAEQPLQKLSGMIDEVTSLMVPEQGHAVYVQRIVPDEVEEPPAHEGERVPLHATAGGKAILAYVPQDERRRTINHPSLEASDEQVADRDGLDQELKGVRDTRTAYVRDDYFDGWYSIGVPITDEDRRAVGAITVSAPENRMSRKLSETDILKFVGSTADSIQNHI